MSVDFLYKQFKQIMGARKKWRNHSHSLRPPTLKLRNSKHVRSETLEIVY